MTAKKLIEEAIGMVKDILSPGTLEAKLDAKLKQALTQLDTEQKEKEQLAKDTVTNLLCYILDFHEGEPLAERKLQEIGMSFMGSKYNKKVSQALAGKKGRD